MDSRRRPSSAGGPRAFQLQDADLLDEQEQIVLIEQMERAAGRARIYSKALLSVCGVFVAILYLHFAAHQVLFPWQSMHQSRFIGLLRQYSVAAAELLGVAMALLSIHACLFYPRGAWRALLAASAVLAALQAVFWSIAVYRVAEAERVPLASLAKLLWLPTVPPLFVCLMALAIRVMAGTEAELQLLRASRYNYKRA